MNIYQLFLLSFLLNFSDGCVKQEPDPCYPSPCGPNSLCKHGEYGKGSNKKIGYYCICKENFRGKPPNCGSKCDKNDDCEFNEICHKSTSCVDYCKLSVCGPNSICRNDNHTEPHCSCQEGYIPQHDIGCRLKKLKDTDIPLAKIKEQLETPCENCTSCTDKCYQENSICVDEKCIKSPCLDYCGSSSNCNIFNGTLECYTFFDSSSNPFHKIDSRFQTENFAVDPCDISATKSDCAVAISEALIKTLIIG